MKKKSAPGKDGVFSAEERAAMREYVQERQSGRGEGEAAVLEKIETFTASDRAMAKRVHAIVRTAAPELVPRLWYGMPAYARGEKVVCFFQGAAKFKTRYATLGFSDKAKLDDGDLWPNSYALQKVTSAVEAKIRALVKKAVS